PGPGSAVSKVAGWVDRAESRPPIRWARPVVGLTGWASPRASRADGLLRPPRGCTGRVIGRAFRKRAPDFSLFSRPRGPGLARGPAGHGRRTRPTIRPDPSGPRPRSWVNDSRSPIPWTFPSPAGCRPGYNRDH